MSGWGQLIDDGLVTKHSSVRIELESGDAVRLKAIEAEAMFIWEEIQCENFWNRYSVARGNHV